MSIGDSAYLKKRAGDINGEMGKSSDELQEEGRGRGAAYLLIGLCLIAVIVEPSHDEYICGSKLLELLLVRSCFEQKRDSECMNSIRNLEGFDRDQALIYENQYPSPTKWNGTVLNRNSKA